MLISQATDILKKAGFKVKVLKDNDKKNAKGEVLSQSATEAPKDSEIEITVNQYDGVKNENSNESKNDNKNETVNNTATTNTTTEKPKENTTTKNNETTQVTNESEKKKE